MGVSIWSDDFTTSRTKTIRFPHPTEPADPADYEAHLLNLREPIPGSPYSSWLRVIEQRFVQPDRNDDGEIDIADLIARMVEILNP